MKQLLFILFLFFILSGIAQAQQNEKLRLNFAGVETQIDLLHTTLGTGISYERILAQGKKAGLSAKVRYFFPHRNGILNARQDYKSPIRCSQLLFSSQGYLFIDKKERPGGAFLYASLGFMQSFRTEKKPEGDQDYSGMSSGAEGGIGGHVRLSKRLQLQIKLGLLIYPDWFIGPAGSAAFATDNNYISPVFSVAAGF